MVTIRPKKGDVILAESVRVTARKWSKPFLHHQTNTHKATYRKLDENVNVEVLKEYPGDSKDKVKKTRRP